MIMFISVISAEMNQPNKLKDSLALLIQKVKQRCGLLADQVDAACVVDVIDVSPADALRPVFLLQSHTMETESSHCVVSLVPERNITFLIQILTSSMHSVVVFFFTIKTVLFAGQLLCVLFLMV